jgi:hypothetical protein
MILSREGSYLHLWAMPKKSQRKRNAQDDTDTDTDPVPERIITEDIDVPSPEIETGLPIDGIGADGMNQTTDRTRGSGMAHGGIILRGGDLHHGIGTRTKETVMTDRHTGVDQGVHATVSAEAKITDNVETTRGNEHESAGGPLSKVEISVITTEIPLTGAAQAMVVMGIETVELIRLTLWLQLKNAHGN